MLEDVGHSLDDGIAGITGGGGDVCPNVVDQVRCQVADGLGRGRVEEVLRGWK